MTTEIEQKEKQSISSEQMVIVGSESSDSTPVSFQVLQNIYNEITGKREELEKNYRSSYQIKLEDLDELNIKITQLYEQYNIKSANCSVTIFYTKGSKETYSSFDRFMLLNSNSMSETERIVIKYNFLVILPKTNRTQLYEIEINLTSKISFTKSIPRPIKSSFGIIKFIQGVTAHVSIKYVDYLVARNFQEVINEYIEGLTTCDQNKILKYIIKKSHYVPRITKYALSILILSLIIKSISYYIPSGSTDLNIFSIFILNSFFILFLFYRIGLSLGRLVEDTLDEYQDLSYICLTKGDKKLIGEVKTKNKKKIIKGAVAIVITFCLGIGSSLIANFITK